MKLNEDVRKYAAGQGVSEDEALKRGMQEKKELRRRARRFTRRCETAIADA
jgi:hypothetical protein